MDDEGLVDPASLDRKNGVEMWPTTNFPLEILNYWEGDIEDIFESHGEVMLKPWSLTIAKGVYVVSWWIRNEPADMNLTLGPRYCTKTPLPGHLLLIRNDSEKFLLLPREAKPLFGK